MHVETNAAWETIGEEPSSRSRWIALGVLCLGVVMIVLDTTIVNVALPAIRADLGFSETSLVWVVNGYMLTFGGFLLLSGRLGDLHGHRKVFLGGLVLFTIASLVCGIANSQTMLVAARVVQGIGGSAVSSISLSLVMNLFPRPAERAKAMGVFSFVCAGGGSIGVLLGGFLTQSLDWHWVFLVNIPVGIAVFVLTLLLVPKGEIPGGDRHLDLAGAATATSALMLGVYGIVGGNEAGWFSVRTLGILGAAALLLVSFFVIESRVKTPLLPLRLLRSRNLSTSNTMGVLWAAAMFAWFFLSALYLQLVLGKTSMEVGLAFLPSNIIMAICSLGISAFLVNRFGIRIPLSGGLFLAGCGLLLFARAPVDGTVAIDVLPAMLLLGLGAGVAMNPLILAAMGDVEPSESGLASGVVNTSFMMGGALGLAALASLAGHRTDVLAESGMMRREALLAGYHVAFGCGAAFAWIAALAGALLLREPREDRNRQESSIPM